MIALKRILSYAAGLCVLLYCKYSLSYISFFEIRSGKWRLKVQMLSFTLERWLMSLLVRSVVFMMQK